MYFFGVSQCNFLTEVSVTNDEGNKMFYSLGSSTITESVLVIVTYSFQNENSSPSLQSFGAI